MFKHSFCAAHTWLIQVALGLLLLYRIIVSPWLGNCCRFHPSCSVYAQVALSRFGFFKGMTLVMLRLFRCHPFHFGGVDPVPPYPRKD